MGEECQRWVRREGRIRGARRAGAGTSRETNGAPYHAGTSGGGRKAMTASSDLESITYRRLGILLVAIGAILAAGSCLGRPFVYKLWPALVLILGVGYIGIYAKRRGRGVLYLALGEYLVLFSGLAFYLNFTTSADGGSGWRNLGHLWPLFMAFLAVVFGTVFIVGRRGRFVLFLALLLLVSAVFSFLVLFLGGALVAEGHGEVVYRPLINARHELGPQPADDFGAL